MFELDLDQMQAEFPQLGEARLFAKLQMFVWDAEHLGYTVELKAHDDDDPPNMELRITRKA